MPSLQSAFHNKAVVVPVSFRRASAAFTGDCSGFISLPSFREKESLFFFLNQRHHDWTGRNSIRYSQGHTATRASCDIMILACLYRLVYFFYQPIKNETFKRLFRRLVFWLPAIGRGTHPIPFRTRKLNSAPSTVVVLS